MNNRYPRLLLTLQASGSAEYQHISRLRLSENILLKCVNKKLKSLPQTASRSVTMSAFCLFLQMKSTEVDQGLFTDSYCKVCSAQLISESQRVAHYEVETPTHITSHDNTALFLELMKGWGPRRFGSAPRDTWLIFPPEPSSWHTVNTHTAHLSSQFDFFH